jgi:hypothetical protein
MKKQPLSRPKLDPAIVEKLDAGAHLELLTRNVAPRLQYVDFSSETVRQAYILATYQMFLSHKIPKGEELVCLFPNHRVEKKQVIRCSSYYNLASFNNDVQVAFTDSLDKTDTCNSIKLAICYGKHVYVCAGITGVINIIWASHVNRTNAGNVAGTLYTDVPLVLNMDGTARVKGIFILKPVVHDASDLDRIPITSTSPTFMWDKDKSLFVCEVRSEKAKPAGITTVSRKEALALVSSVIPQRRGAIASTVHNPFAASMDMEEEDDLPSVDSGTPRGTLYFRDTTINVAHPISTTPPIARSDVENSKDKEEIV